MDEFMLRDHEGRSPPRKRRRNGLDDKTPPRRTSQTRTPTTRELRRPYELRGSATRDIVGPCGPCVTTPVIATDTSDVTTRGAAPQAHLAAQTVLPTASQPDRSAVTPPAQSLYPLFPGFSRSSFHSNTSCVGVPCLLNPATAAAAAAVVTPVTSPTHRVLPEAGGNVVDTAYFGLSVSQGPTSTFEANCCQSRCRRLSSLYGLPYHDPFPSHATLLSRTSIASSPSSSSPSLRLSLQQQPFHPTSAAASNFCQSHGDDAIEVTCISSGESSEDDEDDAEQATAALAPASSRAVTPFTTDASSLTTQEHTGVDVVDLDGDDDGDDDDDVDDDSDDLEVVGHTGAFSATLAAALLASPPLNCVSIVPLRSPFFWPLLPTLATQEQGNGLGRSNFHYDGIRPELIVPSLHKGASWSSTPPAPKPSIVLQPDDPGTVVDALMLKLTCPVCYQGFRRPKGDGYELVGAHVGRCGHLVCAKCSPQTLASRKKCPVCSRPLRQLFPLFL